MSQAALDRLQAVFGSAIVETHSLCGDDTARVSASPTGFASILPPIASRISKRRWVTVLPPADTSIA